MYKVIISDLDGTLFNSQHEVSAFTREVVQGLVGRGFHFLVATGRHLIDVRNVRATLGVECDLITANGAVVADHQDRLMLQRTLPEEIVADLVSCVPPDQPEIGVHVYSSRGWHVARENPGELSLHKDAGFRYEVTNLDTLEKHDINKVFYTGDHDALLALERTLLGRYGQRVAIAFSRDDCLEVMPRDVNKGNAARLALAARGFSLHEAVAFGDGMNDYEMLSMAGLGVVMGNASRRLKESLPDQPVAGSCDEDGVARYLRQLFA